jgi:hypothetical protein
MRPATYSNSAGWTLVVAEHHQTDDIDEIREALEGEIPYQRIDAVIALARIDGHETLTVAQIHELHNTEYVAPLADFPFVGLSADWIDHAWVIDGDERMHEAHTVVHEDENGYWRILRREEECDEHGNSITTDILEDTFATPLGALVAYRAQA